MSEWWLSRGDGKTEGPLSTRALVEGLVAGEIPKRSHVCAVGEQQWHLVSEIEEIWEAVDPSESRTSVTETPWFVDRTDSGQHKLADADAGGDERTQLTSTNGSELSAGKAAPGAANTGTTNAAGVRPSPSRSDDVSAKMSASQSDPERRNGGARADARRSLPNAISETGFLQSNLSAAPNLSARPSPAPASPGHRPTEGSAAKPAQKSTVQARPSPAPPARSRSAELGSANSNARPSHTDAGAPRATPAPASGVKPTSTPVPLQPHPQPAGRAAAHQAPPLHRQTAPLLHEPGAARPQNTSEQVQSTASPPARAPAQSQTTEGAPRPSNPGLPGLGQGTSAPSLAAGLTPLGLKPHDPLSSTAPLFAGLAGLSPLPGAIATPQPQNACDTAAPVKHIPAEPSKAPLPEPSRPSAPPSTRNAYGASPLAGTRPRPSAIPPQRKASAVLSSTSSAPSPTHGSPNAGLVSAPIGNRAANADSKPESAVTIQPIIALAAPPPIATKPDEQQQRLGSAQSALGHSPEGTDKPTRTTPDSKLSPLTQSSPGPVHAPHTVAASHTPRATDWDEDVPTRFVARTSTASTGSSNGVAPAKGEGASTADAASTAIDAQTRDTADEATTLLRTRVEPSRPQQSSIGSEAPDQIPPFESPPANQPSSTYPRTANLRAIAEAHALGPDAIVKDPAQLLEDVEDEAGPPEVPIVQLPMVAPVVAPRVPPQPSSPPVSTAPACPVPSSAPIPAQPTALAAPPSTPPPAHNPRLSVPTIVLKPEPIVHQEATQPAVRALRKRSPFRLSYGSLIGLMLAIAVVCLIAYLTIL